jgi:HPt (histidine-containing phosphotransfer) domain-containing protein
MSNLGLRVGSGSAGASEVPTALLEPARIKFRGLILDRILAFEAFCKEAAEGDSAQRALTDIADLAHKISGVGATLGFDQVGGIAGALERCIRQEQVGLAGREHFSNELAVLLESLLVAMEDLLDD